jgi:molybdopterin-guanine dinucleotide biosynthesis protein A
MWAMVLAGGSSRRMGRRKQDLRLGAATMLERSVALAREVADEVLLVGDRTAARRMQVPAAEDWKAGEGPLSALAGGLSLCPEGGHFVLGCDLPFLQAPVLRRLAELLGDAQAVVPLVDGRRHPLSAVFTRECLAPALRCLERGERRMDALLQEVRLREVTPEQVAPLDLGRAVTNVNTPEDYRRAREQEGGGP